MTAAAGVGGLGGQISGPGMPPCGAHHRPPWGSTNTGPHMHTHTHALPDKRVGAIGGGGIQPGGTLTSTGVEDGMIGFLSSSP